MCPMAPWLGLRNLRPMQIGVHVSPPGCTNSRPPIWPRVSPRGYLARQHPLLHASRRSLAPPAPTLNPRVLTHHPATSASACPGARCLLFEQQATQPRCSSSERSWWQWQTAPAPGTWGGGSRWAARRAGGRCAWVSAHPPPPPAAGPAATLLALPTPCPSTRPRPAAGSCGCPAVSRTPSGGASCSPSMASRSASCTATTTPPPTR